MNLNALAAQNRATRRGIALLGALAVLAAVGTLSGLILWKEAAARRFIDRHAASLQAEHLARGVLELAIARLLDARPKERVEWRFTAAQLVPGGSAVVEVRPSKDSPARFQVVCNASYSPSGQLLFNRTAEAVLRFEEKDGRLVAERVLPPLAGAH